MDTLYGYRAVASFFNTEACAIGAPDFLTSTEEKTRNKSKGILIFMYVFVFLSLSLTYICKIICIIYAWICNQIYMYINYIYMCICVCIYTQIHVYNKYIYIYTYKSQRALLIFFFNLFHKVKFHQTTSCDSLGTSLNESDSSSGNFK